jgi:hypothetical protein
MLNKEFLDTLTPVEIQMVHQYINILFKNKITSTTANYENLETSVDECPYCHCRKLIELKKQITDKIHNPINNENKKIIVFVSTSVHTWKMFGLSHPSFKAE